MISVSEFFICVGFAFVLGIAIGYALGYTE